MALRREIKTQAQSLGIISYDLGPAKIFLDDVQLIYDTLFVAASKRAESSQRNKEDSTVTQDSQEKEISVAISAGEAKADLPDDLRDANPEELERVRIAIKDPLVSVDLWRQYADVSAESSDPEATALAVGIRDFVNNKRSLRSAFHFWGRKEIAFFMIALGLSIGVSAFGWKSWRTNVIFVPSILAVIVGVNCWFAYRFGSVHVIPRRESEVRGLSSETRKQVAIALISAIMGAVILGLAGFWAGLYVHH
jgi:hypothetical protein